MKSPKDYGLTEGYTIASGDTAPADHTVVPHTSGGWGIAVPTQVLEEEHKEFSNNAGWSTTSKDPVEFGKSYINANSVLNAAGITKTAGKGVKVGVDFKGQPVYSDPKLANSTDTEQGKMLTLTSGVSLGAMGAFSDYKEAERFINIGNFASSSDFQSKLDTFKTNKDSKGFIEALSSVNGGSDRAKTDYTAYKLFENWSSMSPTQKSLGISALGMQGFVFGDGKTFETKRLTPEIPGAPSMDAAQGFELASKGINVAPATRKWNQVTLIQDTMFTPKGAADVVNTADSLGILGYGEDGRAVEMDEKRYNQSGMSPEPHYGVGAASIPAGTGIPTGYSAVKNAGGKVIVVPTANRGTVMLDAPEVASKTAAELYNRWPNVKGSKQDKGVLGGSALVGGLDSMTTNNPYSLGAVVTNASYEHVGVNKDISDLGHVTRMSGITLSRLTNGGADKSIDSKGLAHTQDGPLDDKVFGATMKSLRGEYARQGIPSKEVGYQLANQGYAEGRYNESQLVSIYRSLDMTFDDNGHVLAQKLLTGKNKGIEILERRRG